MGSDSRQLSTVMIATLSAELEGKVPADLVADLVRAVLDESRRSAHDRGGRAVDGRGSATSGALRTRPLICVTRTTGQPEQTGDEPNDMEQC